ncbi:MAG: CHASE2 domain-containing protein [Armatimonadota bacterium]
MESSATDLARERWISLAVALVILLVLVGLFMAGHLQAVDNWLSGIFFHIRGELPPPKDILICAIDADSVADLGSWPWPVHRHAQLLNNLDEAGARLVAFDLPSLAKLRADDPAFVGTDAFTDALAASSCATVLPMVLESGVDPTPEAKAARIEGRSLGTGRLPTPPNLQPGRLSLPAAPLIDAADGLGFLNVFPDLDGTIRDIPLMMSYRGKLYPSFSLECFRLFRGRPQSAVKLRPSKVSVGDLTVPVLPSGEMVINYRGGHLHYDTISYHSVYSASPESLAQQVEGRLVVVGPIGSDMIELFRTPVDARLPGVELTANALATLLTGSPLRPAPNWSVMLLMASIMLLFAITIPQTGAFRGVLVMLAVLAVTVGLAYYRFGTGLLMPMGGPFLATLFIGSALITRSAAVAERRRKEADIALQSRMQAITGIGRLIDSSLDRSELLEEVMRWVETELEVEAVSMLLVDEDSNTLHFEVALGEKGDEVKDYVLQMGEGIAGTVAQTGEPMIVNDARRDPLHHKQIPREIGYQVHNVLCVPMVLRREVVGVIEAMNRTDGMPFTEQDSALLTVIAQEAALFLENARLYSILQNRVDYANAELREANRQLASEKAKVETMVEEMVDGVLATDREGMVVLLNDAAESILGVLESEAVGEDVMTVLQHPDLARLMATPLEAHGGVYAEEIEIGENRPVALQVSVASYGDEDEEIGGKCMILSDITELKRVDQLKTDLIGFVSHELKTPLTNIGLYSQLLQDRLPQKEEKLHEIAAVIDRQRVRMGHMVEDFLNVSRLESDRELPMEHEHITDIQTLIHNIVELHSHMRDEHIIEINLPEDLPDLWADRTKIEEIFANLISNAFKFSPKGGRIEIAAEPSGDVVQFSVSDEGIGIPAEERENLFQRFERLSASASRIPGTGLGLYVCRHLVEAHGGEIWVESVENDGSTFYFTVPAYRGQSAEQTAEGTSDET